MTVNGIDVSSYQSETYSTGGLAFVIVKRTEGRGYVNPKASAQVAHGRAARLLVGHYCYPHIHDGASADADYFLSHLGSDLHAGDLIVLDWEWYGQAGVTAAEANAYKDQWLARVKAKTPGHKVGLYSDVSNWTHVDQNSNCGDFLWIATGGKPAGQPGIQHPWTIHQYSTAGGIDHDVAAFPDKAALLAWANPAAPKPPPKPAPKPPAAKYEPFPGAAFFMSGTKPAIGKKSKIFTAMGKRLVAVGCGRYHVGPSDTLGQADVDSYEAFQRKYNATHHKGWSGSALKWPPGKETWDALQVPNV